MTDGNTATGSRWIRLVALLAAALPACGGTIAGQDLDGDGAAGDAAGE
ncbi:MAG: hypothetical protein HY905_22020 [Deltaproteobacteria bacterium]|nr:hypothetical protein [Deltaproteobacteria bacterium]